MLNICLSGKLNCRSQASQSCSSSYSRYICLNLFPGVRVGQSAESRRHFISFPAGFPMQFVTNALNESLISELMRSTTILPTDLELLDGA